MMCEQCGEGAVTARDDRYFCGRCALRVDWEAVALTAQGLAVHEAVAASPPAAAPAADPIPPADPFAG